MRDLSEIFSALGCREVRTYIQSGNVLFEPPARGGAGFPERARAAIQDRAGLSVPLVVRSAEELERIAGANPFLAAGADVDHLHVMFLADEPAASGVQKLDRDRSPPDRFELVGRQVYLSCPGGLGKTKLTNDYFDRALGTISTVRNWRTVLKLVELAGLTPGTDSGGSAPRRSHK
jgi:uncharacterized protein (DUF1697 family)